MKTKRRDYGDFDPRTQHWAALPIEDLLPVLMGKMEDYYDSLAADGQVRKWKTMYNMYYAKSDGGEDTYEIRFIGDNDEGIKVTAGHMRNILQHIYNSATSQDPNWVCRAVNNDNSSRAQTYVGKSVLEYFLYERDLVEALTGTAEMALVLGKAYTWLAWDLIDNDIIADAHSPLTVIHDLKNHKTYGQDWYIVVEMANKWDVIAKYEIPEDKIEDLECEPPWDAKSLGHFGEVLGSDEEGDQIPLFHFYYKKTPSMPNGRYVCFASETEALYPTKDSNDDRLPYSELPVYPMEHGRMFLSPHSHTVAYDIAPHEKLHNVVLSTIHSMLHEHGKKVIFGPPSPSYEDIGGMTYIPVDSDQRPPGILDMSHIDESLFKVIELEVQQMQTLSGVSGPIRGDDKGMKSGSMAALYHSTAVQFQSGYHQKYNRLLERVGTGMLRLLKEFYDERVIIEIVGMDGEPYLDYFSRDKISAIDRAVVENGPSVLRTMAGKLHFADSMLDKGLIQSPDDYIDAVDTGQIQGLVTPTRHRLSSIRGENERLMRPEELTIGTLSDPRTGQLIKDDTGQPVKYINEVRALLLQDHAMHINEHMTLVEDPRSINNQDMMSMVLIHITEHIWQAKNTPPELLTALGRQPFPSGQPQQGQPQQGQRGGRPPSPVPQNQPGGNPQGPPAMQQLSEQNLQAQSGNVPDANYPVSGMPSMPKNPIV